VRLLQGLPYLELALGMSESMHPRRGGLFVDGCWLLCEHRKSRKEKEACMLMCLRSNPL
jgi:hypothetical protein